MRLLAGMPVWVYGCYGRPAFEVDDSTGFPATGAACPLGTADVHPIRLGPGDSLVTSFGLYTLTGGMYRAQVMYGVNQGGCCVVAEAKFVVQ
ncbi:MAG TPA: hypothetical protein VEV39_00280 [Gemmatimonadales bacterium]|nr:hypothetical protein [Gemmatimonadales bacterium]